VRRTDLHDHEQLAAAGELALARTAARPGVHPAVPDLLVDMAGADDAMPIIVSWVTPMASGSSLGPGAGAVPATVAAE
jgi:hypothetical protein